eukprot:2700682-Pleurochrysis_carterae.AAC.1
MEATSRGATGCVLDEGGRCKRLGRTDNCERLGHTDNCERLGHTDNCERLGRTDNCKRLGRTDNCERLGRIHNCKRLGRTDNCDAKSELQEQMMKFVPGEFHERSRAKDLGSIVSILRSKK